MLSKKNERRFDITFRYSITVRDVMYILQKKALCNVTFEKRYPTISIPIR